MDVGPNVQAAMQRPIEQGQGQTPGQLKSYTGGVQEERLVMSHSGIIFNQEVIAALMCKQDESQILPTGDILTIGWIQGPNFEYISPDLGRSPVIDTVKSKPF